MMCNIQTVKIDSRTVINWNLIGQSKNGSKSVNPTKSGRKNSSESRCATTASQTTTGHGLEGVNIVCERIDGDICTGKGIFIFPSSCVNSNIGNHAIHF